MRLVLSSLGNELCTRILMFSDIATVLRLSQYFHTFATVKQLWLSLIANLRMMDNAEICTEIDLVKLTCNELILIAKKAAIGLHGASWRPRKSYEIAMRPASIHPGEAVDTFKYAKLVGGGQQIAIACAGYGCPIEEGV
ncbi:hypothetical protein B0H14DRAFT_2631492 [Mycena olivaceomarginata]|nr:hypothetical protein B0H14DRAFT_2631492 [Mycena olivaceomarginata]